MEENGVDHEASMERASDLLVKSKNTEEVETENQVFQHLAYMETGDPSFGPDVPQAVLPITVPILEDVSQSLNAQMQLSQTLPLPAEGFQLVRQSGHPLYELQASEGSSTHMMIVASQSENGQVLHVIPSKPGIAQVIIPQGQLLDVTSSQDASEDRNGGSLRTVAVAAVADGTSRYILHPPASLAVSKTTATRLLEDTFPVSPQPLSSNTPTWARRLRNCEGAHQRKP